MEHRKDVSAASIGGRGQEIKELEVAAGEADPHVCSAGSASEGLYTLWLEQIH